MATYRSRFDVTRVRLALAVLAFLGCGVAPAQRLIVTTTTLSAAREATRVYLQSVDMGVGAPLPGPDFPPGLSPRGPLLLAPDADRVFVSTENARRHGDMGAVAQGAYLSVYRTAPFHREDSLAFEPGWQCFAGCVIRDAVSGTTMPAALGTRPDGTGGPHGRLEIYRLDSKPGAPFPIVLRRWDLPGAPVASVVSPPGDRIAVLCAGSPEIGPLVHVIQVTTGNVTVSARRIVDADSQFGAAPAGLALTRDGKDLLILTSGYSLGPPSGELTSWLHAIDPASGEERSNPLRIPGGAQPEDTPLHPVGDASCWVATRSPGMGFAYATCARVTETGIVKEVETPLTEVSVPLQIATDPQGRDVAVGVENRLEIWPEGRRGGPSQTYKVSVRVLRWTGQGLFVGEAGRIHWVDPGSCSTTKTVQLQSGWVTDLIVLPPERLPAPDPDADGVSSQDETRMGTSPINPDTDGDGIPDGSDPEPAMPSPRLMVPHRVVFHGKAVGQEIKGFRIKSPCAKNSTWQIDYDRASMPWLKIHPVMGVVPRVVYMGVDPGRYLPGKAERGFLTVRMTGARSDVPAAGSPARIEVCILPEQSSELRKILWIGGENAISGALPEASDMSRFQSLAAILAGPPHYFAHAKATMLTEEALDPYTVVVLDARGAARGAVTRQALLEYVARGGALLFLGAVLSGGENRELTEWLNPLGIRVDLATPIEGTFPAGRAEGLCRHWDNVSIRNGCVIQPEDPLIVLIPGGDSTAIFLTRSYGRGRMAALASATPLENASMRKQSSRLLAEDLFGWLAQAGCGPQEQDMDGDGLPDYIEDRIANGEVDIAETDYLDPDTDGDGVTDGAEDANLNGRVDEGETSPLNPDSNNNGILDGADEAPLPPAGAPIVEQLYPVSGPAEGGSLVGISGRHFSPDTTVWFGNRQAPRATVLRGAYVVVETPPCETPAGGNVSLRVGSASTHLEGVWPAGFRYGPRTRVLLFVHAAPATRRADSSYEGRISLRIESPPEVLINQVVLLLKADPHDGFQWGEVKQDATTGRAQPRIISRVTGSGDLLIAVFRDKQSAAIIGEIGPISWELAAQPQPPPSIRIAIEQPQVMGQNGQPLDVTVRNATLTVTEPR